jgi:exodeoxyribonuclease-5
MSDSNSFSEDLKKQFAVHFSHQPNTEQAVAIAELINFTVQSAKNTCFILKGYAGTGKTSLLGAYIQSLAVLKKKTVLMAPTGRAAKVLSLKSKKLATTIHKRIYFSGADASGSFRLNLAPNKSKDTVFIIDEASMIGDYSLQADGSVSRNLLADIFEYVYQGDNCKLIFLGDEGQLPPVGSIDSPALSAEYLSHHFAMIDFNVVGLTTVVRQQASSGILANATHIREAQVNEFLPTIDLNSFQDTQAVPGDELIEKIDSSYSKYGADEVMIITRSNKRANLYNQHIRNSILYMEEELCGGDLVMVVKNNYYWLDPLSQAGFIANGELLKIHRVKRIETVYNVRFARLEVSLIDYPEMDRFETIAFMETLTIEEPNLKRAFLKDLFFEIEKDFEHEKNKQKRYQAIMKSPYFNALQIKFAYAVTCHKSQGGQWSVVFVDHGYIEPTQLDNSFLRWLYTATTRATEQLYFVNLLAELVEEN